MKNSFSADHNHHSERKPSVTPNLPRKVEEKRIKWPMRWQKGWKEGDVFPSLTLQTDFSFFYTPPLSVLCVTLSLPPLCTALKRAAKLVPSDAPAQWRTKNRQSSGHARAREVGRTKLGQRRLLDALTVNDYVVWGGEYLTSIQFKSGRKTTVVIMFH